MKTLIYTLVLAALLGACSNKENAVPSQADVNAARARLAFKVFGTGKLKRVYHNDAHLGRCAHLLGRLERNDRHRLRTCRARHVEKIRLASRDALGYRIKLSHSLLL